MQLTEKPEFVTWPETHYVFIEKRGPIPQNAPAAWQDFHGTAPQLPQDIPVTGSLALYKMEPPVYRAGVSVATKPANLPDGLDYERFAGGKYARFQLTGPYSQLGQATTRVMEIVRDSNLKLRDDYHIEHYVNDPRHTPEHQLVTEILLPVA
jgi:predicted transcriptional regulator YdeE